MKQKPTQECKSSEVSHSEPQSLPFSFKLETWNFNIYHNLTSCSAQKRSGCNF